ncbi:putative MSH4 protein [Sordaria macrospora k-hell]|uniref:DNA mismatch repair protein MSH3 n=1 Tax=Sordaria macrospora (strain ATCC MYA-333 / DSM 997 / K(L3346) / K-hell) TaxID=771870 RepID=F7VQX4_SORMK|nr:putative MSH4 protein [Sordaria macrospora k-hell]CCC07907.1 putative MSH4 protein [Sordaria macrospora k-hell]
MEEGFQAHQTRFPRSQSDGWRRRAMSGATTGGEQRRQASTTEPARPNNGFIKPSQLLHSTAPGSFRPPQMPLYYTPAQYDWQDPIGRQIPPGYPLSPLYQSHERQMPATHDNHTVNRDQGNLPFHSVDTRLPHTPLSNSFAFGYTPGYGAKPNLYPSSDGNAVVAGYPYPAFENITATRAWASGPESPQPMTPRRIFESPAIEERPRRDISSSPNFDDSSAASSTAAHGGHRLRPSPPSGPASTSTRSNMGARRNSPRTPSQQRVVHSTAIASSSSSYHYGRGEQQGSDRGTGPPRTSYSKPAAPSFYTQSPVSMASSPAKSQQDTYGSFHDRVTKSRAMSTRSTLLTPVLSDSESDSDTQGQLESHLKNTRCILSRDGPTTPSSALAPKTTAPTVSSEERDHVVCAVSESRSAEVVGIAVINITAGQVDLATILNDEKHMYQRLGDTLWKLASKPEKFLVVNSVTKDSSKSMLISCLEQDFPEVPIVVWGRKHWNEAEGLRMIERFALRDQIISVRSDLENNFYTPCAFSANELNIHFASNALRIRCIQPLNTMGIDRTTAASLELLQNTRRATAKMSTLFGILNSTLTPQGHRLLRTTLLQPSTDKEEIIERYESVEELSTNKELFGKLRKALKELDRTDFERVIVWKQPNPRQPLEEGLPAITNQGPTLPTHAELTKAEQELNNMLMLKAYIRGIDALHDIFVAAECRSHLLRWTKDKFAPEHTEPIQGALEETIEQDARYSKRPIDVRNNRIWAVKAERNAVLQRARSSYKKLTDDINKYFDEMNNQFTQLYMDSNRRYCIKFDYSDVARELAHVKSNKQVSIAGVDVVNGTRDKTHFKCTTAELLKRSRAIQGQADVATMQSDSVIIDLKKRLQEHSSLMFDISDAVALLDMLCSFTQAATTKNYSRPMITDSMVLKEARNPIVELRKNNYHANDVYSGDQSKRFQVITGGNMSGKSTFIRSVALIQIMAQMGSFVPAQFASVSICDRIFARVSTDDAPENNLGAFGVEMRETNVILRQATEKSMVIMDELGRGTSPGDGMALAAAVSERLISINPRVFFATHLTALARLLNRRYQRDVMTMSVHLQVRIQTGGENGTQIILPHTLAAGPVQNEDYGIELARLVLTGPASAEGEKAEDARQNRLLLAVHGLTREAIDFIMSDAAFASYICRLRNEFTLTMYAHEEEEYIDGAVEVRPVEVDEAIEGGQLGQKRSAEDDTETESGTGDEGREKRRRED